MFCGSASAANEFAGEVVGLQPAPPALRPALARAYHAMLHSQVNAGLLDDGGPNLSNMKTAYELAMERLGKSTPLSKLTHGQKQQLAELDSQYAAKVAGREIHLQEEIAKTANAGDSEKMEQLQRQLAAERKALQVELEEKKEEVRRGRS